MSWLKARVHVFVLRHPPDYFNFGVGGPRVGATNSPMYQQLEVRDHKAGV